MWDRLKQDALRWIDQGRIADPAELTPMILLLLLYRHLPLRAMAWYRLGCWFQKKNVKMLPGFIQRLLYRHYGLDMIVGMDIGGGLYMPHTVGVTIALQRMGRNCTVMGNITIGMRHRWVLPKIGNDVYIGTGARLLGDITVGDGARVGANAVVLDDVPPGMTVVGSPARVVRKPNLYVGETLSEEGATAPNGEFNASSKSFQ